MNKLEKSIILQLVGLVDEQQALIGELTEQYQPMSQDSARAIAGAVKRIKLKFENSKRDIGLLIGEPKCIQEYGDPPRLCRFTPKWYFLNPHTKELEGPYCATHARQFLTGALRPIEAYPDLIKGDPGPPFDGAQDVRPQRR